MGPLDLEFGLRASFCMKRSISLALTVLWLASLVVLAEEPAIVPTVTPAEAATQDGKEVKVKGRVEGQKTSAKGVTYLNFGGKYPNHVFSCVLRAKDFPSAPPSFEGKEVEVTGVIKMYEGKPSMDISSLEQIHVIEEAASTAPESKPSEPAS
jgi:DNA/RNA endonuclease YhcR with UshA esterase domain